MRDGDSIEIDASPGVGTVHVALTTAVLDARGPAGGAAPPRGGLLEKYASVVGQANKGAVTHSGVAARQNDLRAARRSLAPDMVAILATFDSVDIPSIFVPGQPSPLTEVVVSTAMPFSARSPLGRFKKLNAV